jgi:hypothetical protein
MVGGKIHEEEITPIHAREMRENDIVMLETFFPDMFEGKAFYKVGMIKFEKGKKIITLNPSYAINKKMGNDGLSDKD